MVLRCFLAALGLLLLSSLTLPVPALSWSRQISIGGGGTFDVQKIHIDASGFVNAVSSQRISSSVNRVIVTKLTPAGTIVWSRILGTTSEMYVPYDSVATTDGTVYVVGGKKQGTTSRPFIHRVSSSGTPFTRVIVHSEQTAGYFQSVVAVPGAGIFAGGVLTFQGSQVPRAEVTRFNSNLGEQWRQRIDNVSTVDALRVIGPSRIVAAGSSSIVPVRPFVWVFHPNGQAYGTGNVTVGGRRPYIAPAPGNGFYLAYGRFINGNEPLIPVLARFDQNGNRLWVRDMVSGSRTGSIYFLTSLSNGWAAIHYVEKNGTTYSHKIATVRENNVLVKTNTIESSAYAPTSLAVDSLDHVYFVGMVRNTASHRTRIVRFHPTTGLTWNQVVTQTLTSNASRFDRFGALNIGGFSGLGPLVIKFSPIHRLVLPDGVAQGGTVSAQVDFAMPTANFASTMSTASDPGITVPSSVSLPANSTVRNFNLTASPSANVGTLVKVRAAYAGATVMDTIRILPGFQSFTLSPSRVNSGQSTTARVTLSSPAPAGGATVVLSGPTNILTTTPSIVIPAGATSGQISLPTRPTNTNNAGNIIARFAGASRSTPIEVLAPVPASWSGVNSIKGGRPVTFTLRLTGLTASSGQLVVSGSSSSTYAVVPTQIIFAANSLQRTVTITTRATTIRRSIIISATRGSTTVTKTLDVVP